MKKVILVLMSIVFLTSCVHLNVEYIETSPVDNDVTVPTDFLEIVPESVSLEISNGNVNIEKKTVSANDNKGQKIIEAKYDIIVLSDSYKSTHQNIASYIDNFNKTSEEEANNFISDFKSDVINMREDNGFNDMIYTSESNVSIVRSDEKVFSFSNVVSSYTGGAHGNAGTICYNFDVVDGNEIEQKDLFTDINELRLKIENKLDTEEEYKGALFEDYKNTLTDVLNAGTLQFLVDKNDVKVLFDPYLLGPWASGTITVNFTSNENFINKKYF